MFISYLVAVAVIHYQGRRAAARGDTPLLTDFTSLYAASMLLRQQPAADLYRPREMYRVSLAAAQAAYGGELTEKQSQAVGFHPWLYPPSFIVFALPLASLPYFAAWLGWLAVTALPYLLAMRTILKDSKFWLIALGAPPVFFNIMYGQTGFLIAGLIGLGLAWLRDKPILAGCCIGLASVKPHFGILIPLALICGAHWRAFAAASATVLGSVVLSVAAFGLDPWYAFIGTAGFNFQGFERNAYTWGAMTTVLSSAHSMGASVQLAWKIQIAVAILFAGIICRYWWWSERTPGNLALQSALLCAASLLAVPMAYLYDLVLLVPALAFLWKDMQTRGYGRWEPGLLCVAGIGILTLRETATASGNLVGILPALLIAAICIWRILAPTDTGMLQR